LYGNGTNEGKIYEEWFYLCLPEFLNSFAGSVFAKDIRLDSEGKIIGFKQQADFKHFDSPPEQGPIVLADMKHLIETYGFEGTFTYSDIYLDFEHYQNLTLETI
jgi:hypothetical protein